MITGLAIFLAVTCLVFAVSSLFEPGPDPVRPSIRKGSSLDPILSTRIGDSFVPHAKDQFTAVKLALLQAGFDSPRAVHTYTGFRVILAVALPLAAFLSPLDRQMLHQAAALAALVGFYLPAWFVARRRNHRQRMAREGFPDMLDLLLVCTEAGMGVDTAVMKVAEEMAIPHPVLAEHLHQVSSELRAGRSRSQAMRTLADRTGIDEAISLVNLLIQSDSMGSSMADTLRVFSADMRERRLLRAEELAQKVGVKLSVLTVTCFLPAILAVVLTPVVLSIITTAQSMGGR